MKAPQRRSKFLAILAMFSLGPAVLFIETESAAREARSSFSKQAQQFEKMIDAMRQRRVSCAENIPGGALSLDEIHQLIDGARAGTRDVIQAFSSDTPFWEYKRWLPWTASLYSVHVASAGVGESLSLLSYRSGLCRRLPEGDDAALRREEQRSQARLDEQGLKLGELYAQLTVAKAAYERDRPKLTALAWSLGILQAVGWSLLYFSILPYEIRAWRERRAQRKKGSASG